jgi:hypothetical protein
MLLSLPKGDRRWEGFMTEIYTRYYAFYGVADKSTFKITDLFYELPSWFTLADRAA